MLASYKDSLLERLTAERIRLGIGLALGALLFAGLSMPWPAGAATPGTAPVDWVADRDAGELVGMDADHFVVARLGLRAPVRLATAPGGVWVAAAVEGSPIGRHALERVGGDGRLRAVAGAGNLGPVMDLEAAPSGRALFVELGLLGKPTRILSVGGGQPLPAGPKEPGGVLEVAQHSGALSVLGELAKTPSGLEEQVLVGDELGHLCRYSLSGDKLAEVVLGGQLGDLAAGPSGEVLALDLANGGRVLCLSDGLELLWEAPVGLATEGLAMVPGELRYWAVDTTEPLARRFGPGGTLELEVLLPSSDASSIRALADGGALITVPGALLHVDPLGAIAPGQGGFDYLTDIAAGG